MREGHGGLIPELRSLNAPAARVRNDGLPRYHGYGLAYEPEGAVAVSEKFGVRQPGWYREFVLNSSLKQSKSASGIFFSLFS